jgi:hypothetical protein
MYSVPLPIKLPSQSLCTQKTFKESIIVERKEKGRRRTFGQVLLYGITMEKAKLELGLS